MQYFSALEKVFLFCFELNIPLITRSWTREFKVSSERLEDLKIESVTLRLQGQHTSENCN